MTYMITTVEYKDDSEKSIHFCDPRIDCHSLYQLCAGISEKLTM